MGDFLFRGMAMAGLLIAMAPAPGRQMASPPIPLAPAQEPAPDIDESGFLTPLTPAEQEVVLAYIRSMDREVEAHPDGWEKIRLKYVALVRKALPPGKHLIARVMLGGC